MYIDTLPAGDSECIFTILVEDLIKCEHITMGFQTWESSRIFLFLDMDDIKRVLP